ncbi:hypothetical protein CKO12_13390 [Chromatium okenii]|nr:hypothetical protein [Chromatium okenii]
MPKGGDAKPPLEKGGLGGLLFDNGCGGFRADGREYVITTAAGQTTPAPWVNVLANPQFGTVISASGMAYTWSENAQAFRLTPWHNDPVSDSSGETFYLRDEESGYVWSPTALPCGGSSQYVCRHGFGYSIFEHAEDGIHSELCVFVARTAPIKFSVLTLTNQSQQSRRLSVTGYVEWVLGSLRPTSAPHVITEIDPTSGALLARNPYNTEFADHLAFFAVDAAEYSVCGDRAAFIGRNGSLALPVALTQVHLSGSVGAALDPCAALQTVVTLAPGQSQVVVFRLGVVGRRGADDASALAQPHRGATAASAELEAVRQYWSRTLGAVQVETPDVALNILANGWLLYQTLACRLWARSGFYQSGGAFGFRDQLQDAMALVHTEPERLRAQLLLCASRQFVEGDVQHWWHPPSGRGVRTHCSDDLLWLALATSRYVLTTGDTGVLAESAPFLNGRPLPSDADADYDLPAPAEETASLYQHCVRAILHALRFGAHGLPLIGSGDWNDGMNLVGSAGRGESVWLGWFLYEVLSQFSALASQQGDLAFVDRCAREAQQVRDNVEAHAWDGGWYRRAFYDDGLPLGAASQPECQIDSIAQSWAVLSRAGDPDRARRCMAALDARLVRRDAQLIQLLAPPFDTAPRNPGYIKGYLPGVRENGGQYTHAAIWAAMAWAQLGAAVRAWELFDMINPILHGAAPAAIATYKVEPFVIAADVYAVNPHCGRGGWSWYTGSASWMYRLILESLLGLRREVDSLSFSPCLPAAWSGFSLHYRFRSSLYRIVVTQEPGATTTLCTLDGVALTAPCIHLCDDHRDHLVTIRLSSVSDQSID